MPSFAHLHEMDGSVDIKFSNFAASAFLAADAPPRSLRFWFKTGLAGVVYKYLGSFSVTSYLLQYITFMSSKYSVQRILQLSLHFYIIFMQFLQIVA